MSRKWRRDHPGQPVHNAGGRKQGTYTPVQRTKARAPVAVLHAFLVVVNLPMKEAAHLSILATSRKPFKLESVVGFPDMICSSSETDLGTLTKSSADWLIKRYQSVRAREDISEADWLSSCAVVLGQFGLACLSANFSELLRVFPPLVSLGLGDFAMQFLARASSAPAPGLQDRVRPQPHTAKRLAPPPRKRAKRR